MSSGKTVAREGRGGEWLAVASRGKLVRLLMIKRTSGQEYEEASDEI